MRLKGLAFLILIFIALSSSGAVLAQNGGAIEQIDRAMQDVSQQEGRTITRNNSVWSWTERTYDDASLGCPVEGEVYSQVRTVGYSITIEVSGNTYNYRATPDGSIFFECSGGQSAQSTPQITVTPVQPPVITPSRSSTIQPLPSADWWAWAYSRDLDTLYLLNNDGEEIQMPRPRLGNEAQGEDSSIQPPVVSRDSHYMVIAAILDNGNQAFGIYDVARGAFTQVHEAKLNEDINLGFSNGTIFGGSTYIFDESGEFVAIGYSTLDFDSPEASTWRVTVYELATGNAIYQIDSSLTGIPLGPEEVVFTFPRVVYYGADAVHIHLIPAFAEGITTFPAFIWHPNANFFERSTFSASSIDVEPVSNEIVFPYLDPAFDAIEAFGPAPPFNAIGTGDPNDPERLWIDSTAFHSQPLWTNSGAQVLFTTVRGPEDMGRWNVLEIDEQTVSQLDSAIQYVRSLPEGFLSTTNNGRVLFHDSDNPLVGTQLWEAPESSNAELVWASLPQTPFGLSQVVINRRTTNIATVVCPGTPESRLSVGVAGQVTFTDGTRTFLRALPEGEVITAMDEGTTFRVNGGPQCQGAFTWWFVELDDGTLGWVAEGDFGTYYIEPVP